MNVDTEVASGRTETRTEAGEGAGRLLSVVVPVFNEEQVIQAFYDRATTALSTIPGWDLELVFVDDGSADQSFALLNALAGRDTRVKVLRFSRNFGHQIAITAGVDHASGDAVAVIDSDLQDPPEVIADMVAKLEEGYDVIYGQRVDRQGETRLKLWTAAAFYRLLKRLVKIEIPVDVGDFRLMSRRAVLELRLMREKDRFVRGLVSWVGFRQTGVPYRREARFAGATKYPMGKMLKFALDGITAFSTVPLKLATWLGYAASAFAFVYLVSVFVQKAVGVTVEGWATIMVAMLFLGGVQLICLGILGEYIGRIFNEIKPRPMYVVADRVNLTAESASAGAPPRTF
ncbi:MAG: glycosyltransferase family 2 protein [Gemmatimonadota bacterium]